MMNVNKKQPGRYCFCEPGPLVGGSDVVGRGSFAFAARQREGRLALRLREPAGQLGEGLDEGVAFGDAHLPQLDLLTSSPLLRNLVVHLTMLWQVALVAQDHNCDLRRQKTLINLLQFQCRTASGIQHFHEWSVNSVL